jgi:hypothetical protein
MRYFFHLHNDVESMDEEGIEFPDAASAIEHARDEARTMAAESVHQGHLNLFHYVHVTDEAGETVAEVRFKDVVAILD